MNASNIVYFNSFGVKHIPKEIKESRNTKNTIINIHRIQGYHLIMDAYFYIGFIGFKVNVC